MRRRVTEVIMSEVYGQSVETFYLQSKNEKVYFKEWEHVVHQFFTISGLLAYEYNLAKPKFIMQREKKLHGLMPYWRKATELFINESIRKELLDKHQARLSWALISSLIALLIFEF